MNSTSTFCCSYCKRTDQVSNSEKHKYCVLMSALCTQAGLSAPPRAPADTNEVSPNTSPHGCTRVVTCTCSNPNAAQPLHQPAITRHHLCGCSHKRFIEMSLGAPSQLQEARIIQLTAMFVMMTDENIGICVESIIEWFFEHWLSRDAAPYIRLVDSLCKSERPAFSLHFASRIAGITKIAYFNSIDNRTSIANLISSWMTHQTFPARELTDLFDFITQMNIQSVSSILNTAQVHPQPGLIQIGANGVSAVNAHKRKGDQVVHGKPPHLPLLKKRRHEKEKDH